MSSAFLEFDLFASAIGSPQPRIEWQPAADVFRCSGGWFIKVEVERLPPNDVDVPVGRQIIPIRGARRDRHSRKGQQTRLLEIAHIRLERVIELPTPLETAKLGADLQRPFLDWGSGLVSWRRSLPGAWSTCEIPGKNRD